MRISVLSGRLGAIVAVSAAAAVAFGGSASAAFAPFYSSDMKANIYPTLTRAPMGSYTGMRVSGTLNNTTADADKTCYRYDLRSISTTGVVAASLTPAVTACGHSSSTFGSPTSTLFPVGSAYPSTPTSATYRLEQRICKRPAGITAVYSCDSWALLAS